MDFEKWVKEQKPCCAGCAKKAWMAAIESAARRLEEEAKYGCPCNEDERLTWENADVLRDWAGLPKREDVASNAAVSGRGDGQ